MKIAIYDMDGTIVCSLHRYRTITDNHGKERIDLAYWQENAHKAMNDSLLPLAKQYKEDLANKNCYTIIATARVLREPDQQYIADVLGKPDYIISRKEGDNQSGSTLKVKGLQRLFNLKQFKTAKAVFYEDNIAYLKAVTDSFPNVTGVFVPSLQGH